jgi:phytoene desaturase
MIQIPQAFRRIGERLGVEYRLQTLVTRVLVHDGRAFGVRLADGTEITARVIVSDVNARMLYQEMIGEENLPPLVRRGLRSYKYSLACPMIYLGLNYEPPLAAHHSIIAISPEELNHYWPKCLLGVLPSKHFGLICWPTLSDPSLAPRGKHLLNIIPEGFYHLHGTTWEDEKEEFLDRTVEFLSRAAIPGLDAHIEHADIVTPRDFERRLLLPEGAIYALQQDLPALTVFRPAAKSKSIQGLYLAGSSTHPGGGVPTCVASGHIAAQLIAQYEN